jgi:LruC domain-containing protein
MKKLAYIIIILIALALVPSGALAGSFTVFGVTVTAPDSYKSCTPANDIVFSNVAPNTVEYEFFRYDAATNLMVPLATGSLTADGSVPFPYPSSFVGPMTFSVTVKVVRPTGTWLKGQAQWTVTCEPPPVINVTKTADPTQVMEPGGVVAFTVVVENQSNPLDPVTITSLVDDIHGDLNGEGTCSVPQTIQPGDSYTCVFAATVTGDVGYSETDTVTASGTDDEGTPVSDSDDATVTVIEPPPVINVTKTANPITVTEPGGEVTFTVVVENQSNPLDPVTITSLVDDIHGDLNGQGTCSVPQTIQPGDSYTCTFTATVSGNIGYSETDTVTASGTDDEGTPVSDSDDATVTVIGRYKYYIPLLYNGGEELPCGSVGSFGATIGFEDWPITSTSDFDYNDWITDIGGILDFTAPPSCGLVRLDLTFTPQARGAVYNHTFHMRFTANTFASNGTATLTIFDQNGAVLNTSVTAFDASVDNDFTIFSQTSDVFPVIANTREGSTVYEPGRTAHLTIVFDTLSPFAVPPNSLSSPHGDNLFFDPYLYVIDTGDTVHRGDLRLLAVPVATYLWPEERRRIDTVYSGVQYVPGTPPMLNFEADWWELPHNNCVFGDGVVCSLPFIPGLK